MKQIDKLAEELIKNDEEPAHCHAQKDGDCEWINCPQLRDNEPMATGRHCPLDKEPKPTIEEIWSAAARSEYLQDLANRRRVGKGA